MISRVVEQYARSLHATSTHRGEVFFFYMDFPLDDRDRDPLPRSYSDLSSRRREKYFVVVLKVYTISHRDFSYNKL